MVGGRCGSDTFTLTKRDKEKIQRETFTVIYRERTTERDLSREIYRNIHR